MPKYRKLSHSIYSCTYHIVWTPKYRFRVLEGKIKEIVSSRIKQVCEWYSVEIEEISVQPDHIHLVCSIPPKEFGIEVCRDSKREDGHTNIFKETVIKREAILGEPFLGKRLLSKYSWYR